MTAAPRQYRYYVRSPDGRAIFGLDILEAAQTVALEYGRGAHLVDTLAQAYHPMLQKVVAEGDGLGLVRSVSRRRIVTRSARPAATPAAVILVALGPLVWRAWFVADILFGIMGLSFRGRFLPARIRIVRINGLLPLTLIAHVADYRLIRIRIDIAGGMILRQSLRTLDRPKKAEIVFCVLKVVLGLHPVSA